VQAFVLEHLFPTGWRRDGQLFWRFGDAEREASRILKDGEARGVRILPVRVNSDAVFERLVEQESEAASA
jgi:hypothetical protein